MKDGGLIEQLILSGHVDSATPADGATLAVSNEGDTIVELQGATLIQVHRTTPAPATEPERVARLTAYLTRWAVEFNELGPCQMYTNSVSNVGNGGYPSFQAVLNDLNAPDDFYDHLETHDGLTLDGVSLSISGGVKHRVLWIGYGRGGGTGRFFSLKKKDSSVN